MLSSWVKAFEKKGSARAFNPFRSRPPALWCGRSRRTIKAKGFSSQQKHAGNVPRRKSKAPVLVFCAAVVSPALAFVAATAAVPTDRLQQYRTACYREHLKRDLMSNSPNSEHYTGNVEGTERRDYCSYVGRPNLDGVVRKYFDTQPDERVINFVIGPPKSGKKALVCGNIKNSFVVLEKPPGLHTDNMRSVSETVSSSLPSTTAKLFWAVSTAILRAKSWMSSSGVDPVLPRTDYLEAVLSTLELLLTDEEDAYNYGNTAIVVPLKIVNGEEDWDSIIRFTEKGLCHVVMTSSHPYFSKNSELSEATKNFMASKLYPFVVSDLEEAQADTDGAAAVDEEGEEEGEATLGATCAKSFLLGVEKVLIEEEQGRHLQHLEKQDFDAVFEVYGGRVGHLKEWLQVFLRRCSDREKVDSSEPIPYSTIVNDSVEEHTLACSSSLLSEFDLEGPAGGTPGKALRYDLPPYDDVCLWEYMLYACGIARAASLQDVEQFVGGDNGDTVRKRSSENYGFPKLQPRTMLRNVFLKDEDLFWRFLERGFVEWRSYNGAAGGEGAGATIDKNEGYLTVSPMMHYAMTKKVHCSNGDFKAAVSRQEHMHDRLIMRNSTHDSRALESEREELERSENVHLEAWLFAKRSYCDGKLTKRQFEMVELELRLKDHHFEVLLDELNLREKTLLRTMDSVRRKLLQAKRRRHGD